MTEKQIWDKLVALTGSEIFTAALMGNMKAESALKANNLQNSYEKRLGYTDETYTAVIDKHTYTRDRFSHDCAGYGLCQWTSSGRKTALYNYWLNHDPAVSIGDCSMQIDFCISELRSAYPGIWNKRQEYKTIWDATADVLRKYERPADQSDANVTRRANMGQAFYDAYHTEDNTTPIDLSMVMEELAKAKTYMEEAEKHILEAMEELEV